MPAPLRFPLLRQAVLASSAIALFGSALAMEAAEPAPGIIGPNASRITATVLARKVWPPGSLENVRPLVQPDQTFYSVRVRLTASDYVSPDLDHLAPAGRTLELFTLKPLFPDVAGKTIHATIKLIGDTNGSRWMIEQLSPLP